MKKFGEFICKHKIAILIIAVLLCIPSIYGMMATRVNYDILSYLPSNIETVKGEKILSNDFGMGSFSIVLVKDIPQKNLINLENRFREIDSVKDVIGITDVTGSQIPVDMLPDDVLNKIYKEDGTTAVLVTFEDGIAEDRTLDAIQTLRDITDENCKISGMSATNLDIKDICNSEVIIYVIIAVKNQEEKIEGFLRSILFKILYGREDYLKNIIVADLNSSDNTKEIAKKLSKDYDILKVTGWKECKDIIDNVDEQ